MPNIDEKSPCHAVSFSAHHMRAYIHRTTRISDGLEAQTLAAYGPLHNQPIRPLDHRGDLSALDLLVVEGRFCK